jgi:hypothetical protein
LVVFYSLAGRFLVFGRWFRKKPVPLTGSPPIRRVKTYTGETGYVYQYTYSGQRPSRQPAGTEFVFSVTTGREEARPLPVVVEEAAIKEWSAAHARSLSASERYALAKLALFAAFDQRPSPADLHAAPIRVRAADVEAFMQHLDPESPPQ